MKSTPHQVLKARLSKTTSNSSKSSSFKLKKKYLFSDRLKNATKRQTGVYGSYNYYGKKDEKTGVFLHNGNVLIGGLNCCGISEVILQEFYETWRENYKDEKHLEEILGPLILQQASTENSGHDKRVLIWGRPVINIRENPDSMYDNVFYTAMEKAMKKLGFKQINKTPYKNGNSGNKIKAFVGQLP